MKTTSNQSGLTFEKYDRDHIAIYFNETSKEVPAGTEGGESQTVYEYDTLNVAAEEPSEAAFAAAIAASGYSQLEAEAIAASIIFAAVQKEQISGDALEAAKAMVIARISAYDSSGAVNEFTLNGMSMWLDDATRTKLAKRFDTDEQDGLSETKLIYDGMAFDLPITTAKGMLHQIESYARDCFDKTNEHKAAVMAKRSVNTVLSYDYTTGYPQKLAFTL